MFENYSPLTIEELENSPGLHHCVDFKFSPSKIDKKISNAKKTVLKAIKNEEFKAKHEVRKVRKYNYMCIQCNDSIVKINNDWIKRAKEAKLHSPSILTCRDCKIYSKNKYLN